MTQSRRKSTHDDEVAFAFHGDFDEGVTCHVLHSFMCLVHELEQLVDHLKPYWLESVQVEGNAFSYKQLLPSSRISSELAEILDTVRPRT